MRVLQLADRAVDLTTGEIAGRGRLRPAERAMLAYLAERVGVWVGIDELHTRVWGYPATVNTRTAYSTASRLRAAIEADPGVPRHLHSERGEGYRLVDVEWADAPADAHQPALLTNLVEPEGLFFGRDDAVAEILGLPSRLWTLAGPGGVGKTRLAMEVAWRSHAAGGVWFCDLHLATTGDALEAAVGRAIPVVQPIPVGERLRELGDVLIVLDNLEQAAPDAASQVQRWLQDAPRTRFLATSREPLGLGAERVMRLGPLGVEPALALLRDRLGRRGAGSVLGDDLGASLCALVDRLPLALEIVAANVVLLGASAVVDRLRAGGDLRARVDGPDRHRSLDEVLRWSWDGLAADAQIPLATLATLDGAFGIAAAEAALGEPLAVDRIADLVDASLLAPLDDGRFALPATVRNAVRRFLPTPVDPVLDRLLAVRIAQAKAEDPATIGQARSERSPLSLPVVVQLAERLRRRADLDPDLWARVAFHLVTEAAQEGAGADGLARWIELALARARGTIVRAALVFRRAHLQTQLGNPSAAIADYAEAAHLTRRTGVLVKAWRADHNRGRLLCHLGRHAEVIEIATTMEAEAQALGSDPVALHGIGHAAFLRNLLCSEAHDDLVGAERRCRESVDAFRAAGREEDARKIELTLPLLLLHQGRVDETDELLRSWTQGPGSEPLYADFFRCEILWHQGRFDEMIAAARVALARKVSTFDFDDYRALLGSFGTLAIAVGEVALGAGWLRARLELPWGANDGLYRRAHARAVLVFLEEGPHAAWPHTVEARSLSTLDWIPPIASLQGELMWALGDLHGAVEALVDTWHWNRPIVAMFPALLLAETWLRLGERDRARKVAIELLEARVTPVARARAHALLATCAAIDGDRADLHHHLRRTSGVRGPGHRWLAIHRGWVQRLIDGREPDAVEASTCPIDLALQACSRELQGPVPQWALR